MAFSPFHVVVFYPKRNDIIQNPNMDGGDKLVPEHPDTVRCYHSPTVRRTDRTNGDDLSIARVKSGRPCGRPSRPCNF
ncbi:hypothetical protein GWI33_002050 [Rhynchophorus ferrugineus]|uniref:Uncharacterized protein n=1 Tax=Rhynchophorus ferrugineus TaxID=354439 RepID=A0A834ML53_RHYFE|nr:hypothetical protein GWI33_002050 [Rhynchophorus ferrugineus]